MVQILQVTDSAIAEAGNKGTDCQKAAANIAFQAVFDAYTGGILGGFLRAIKSALTNILGLGKEGLEEYLGGKLDEAEEAAKEAFKEWVKEKLKGKPPEIFETAFTKGPCTGTVTSTWDIAAGIYKVVVKGECACNPVATGGLRSARLKDFTVTVTGKVSIDLDYKEHMPILHVDPNPKVTVEADCESCSQPQKQKKPENPVTPPPPSTTGGGGGTVSQPPPAPELPKECDIKPPCPECMPIYNQIVAACNKAKGLISELRDFANQWGGLQNRIAYAQQQLDQLNAQHASESQIAAQKAELTELQQEANNLILSALNDGIELKKLQAALTELAKQLADCNKPPCGPKTVPQRPPAGTPPPPVKPSKPTTPETPQGGSGVTPPHGPTVPPAPPTPPPLPRLTPGNTIPTGNATNLPRSNGTVSFPPLPPGDKGVQNDDGSLSVTTPTGNVFRFFIDDHGTLQVEQTKFAGLEPSSSAKIPNAQTQNPPPETSTPASNPPVGTGIRIPTVTGPDHVAVQDVFTPSETPPANQPATPAPPKKDPPIPPVTRAGSSGFPPFTCNASVTVTPMVRPEGLTELVGDILLRCTGPTPQTTSTGTAAPSPLGAVNFTFDFSPQNTVPGATPGSLNPSVFRIQNPGDATGEFHGLPFTTPGFVFGNTDFFLDVPVNLEPNATSITKTHIGGLRVSTLGSPPANITGSNPFTVNLSGVFSPGGANSPTGSWALYVQDEACRTDPGISFSGWCLNFTENPVTLDSPASHHAGPNTPEVPNSFISDLPGTIPSVGVTLPNHNPPNADPSLLRVGPGAAPTISDVGAGSAGPDTLNIYGTNLNGVTSVQFGGVPSTTFVVNAEGTVITAKNPALAIPSPSQAITSTGVTPTTGSITVTTPTGTATFERGAATTGVTDPFAFNTIPAGLNPTTGTYNVTGDSLYPPGSAIRNAPVKLTVQHVAADGTIHGYEITLPNASPQLRPQDPIKPGASLWLPQRDRPNAADGWGGSLRLAAFHSSDPFESLPSGTLVRMVTRPRPKPHHAPKATPQAAGAPEFNLIANGNASGEAFEFQVFDSTGKLKEIRVPDGLILEPLERGSVQPVAGKPGEKKSSHRLSAYCVNYDKDAPEPNGLYRIAAPQIQEQYKPVRSVMRAGRELAAAGKFHPDSDPAAYVLAIRQYALWTKLENWNEQQFADVFVEKTRRIAVESKVEWNKDMEQAIRALVPGRWRDISLVLEAARELEAAAAPPPAR